MAILDFDGLSHYDQKSKENIDKKLDSKSDKGHKHTKSEITDFPSSLPANGGNADTVNGHTVESDVPADAKFTDTTYSKLSEFTDDVGYVKNTDARLSDARNAKDVYDWAKAKTKPSYTKAEVGLGNVDNTSDANKPVSTAQQTAIDTAYANSNKYTDQKIADLIDGAPETMDTLKEVADAIDEHKSVEEALNAAIGKKANQTELDTHTGNTTIHITASERTNWNAAKTHADSAHARTDATKVEKSTTNGNIKINDTETTVYTHPASHSIGEVSGLQAALDGKGTYSKPSGGIPKSDLASGVQASLGKADTALQSHQDISGKVDNTRAGINSAINKLEDGTDTPQDADLFIVQYVGGGTTNTTYVRKPISALWSYIKGKADKVYSALGHKHTKAEITDFPTSMPASDVSAWAKAKTKPSYTASEVGLGNVGNFKAVSTVASQGLTDTEKSNARTNIGAGTSSFDGNYNNLSNKPTIPTKVSQLTNDSGYKTTDNNTTYTLTQDANDGHKITLTPSTGTATTITIPDNNTTYGEATTSSNGLMTSAMVSKLNGIADGANKTTVDSALSSTSTNPVQNKVVNSALSGKANSSHKHDSADINSLDASKLTGTIDIARLPQGALDRLVRVADDDARFKLTTSDIQLGDTVQTLDNKKMYYVVDETKLSSEDGYAPYTADTATSVPWSGVTGKPSSYTPSSHTHDDRYYTESEIDTKLSAKLDMRTAYGIASCAGSGKYSYCKIATIKISASYINSPIVFELSGRGRHLSELTLIFANVESTDPALGEFKTNYDNCYYIKKTTTSTWEVYGQYSETWGNLCIHRLTGTGSNIGVTVNMTNLDALPSGCTQASYGGNVGYASVAASANAVAWGNVSGAPTSLPASDVYSWAKASSKPSYSWSEIGSKPSTFTPSSHTHSYNDLTNKPTIPTVDTSVNFNSVNAVANAAIGNFMFNHTMFIDAELTIASNASAGTYQVTSSLNTNAPGAFLIVVAGTSAGSGDTSELLLMTNIDNTNSWSIRSLVASNCTKTTATFKVSGSSLTVTITNSGTNPFRNIYLCRLAQQ